MRKITIFLIRTLIFINHLLLLLYCSGYVAVGEKYILLIRDTY